MLHNIFTDFVVNAVSNALPSAGAELKKQLQNQLQKGQYDLESKVGEFLQSGKILSDYINRAQAQSNSEKPEARARATSLVSKGRALLDTYNRIKNEATTALGQIAALKTKIESSPAFNFPDLKSVGTRVLEMLNENKSQISSALSQSGQVAVRLNKQVKDVKNYQKDVENLEEFAEGKGFENLLHDVGSGVTASVVAPVAKIAAVGLLAYLLLPSLVGRFARSRR